MEEIMKQMMEQTRMLQEALAKQAQESREREERAEERITALLASQTGTVPAQSGEQLLISNLSLRIEIFNYSPEEDLDFQAWHKRYGALFEEDGKDVSDAAKARLLVQKLGSVEHHKFLDSIKPKEPKELSFEATVKQMQSLFAPAVSKVMRQYQCFQVKQAAGEDKISFASKVNSLWESCFSTNVNLSTLKCVSFVAGLADSECEAKMRCVRVLEMAETDNRVVTLDELKEECKKIDIFNQSMAGFSNPNQSLNAYALKAQKTKHLRQEARYGRKQSTDSNDMEAGHVTGKNFYGDSSRAYGADEKKCEWEVKLSLMSNAQLKKMTKLMERIGCENEDAINALEGNDYHLGNAESEIEAYGGAAGLRAIREAGEERKANQLRASQIRIRSTQLVEKASENSSKKSHNTASACCSPIRSEKTDRSKKLRRNARGKVRNKTASKKCAAQKEPLDSPSKCVSLSKDKKLEERSALDKASNQPLSQGSMSQQVFMASTREQLQQLQKAQKRARLPTADESILEEQLVDEHVEEDSAASDDQENRQPVQFQPGTTNRGATCLWYHERPKEWGFSNSSMDTARAERLQHSRGRLKRNVIKEQQVITVLAAANFDTDDGLIDAVNLLGLVMQGFADGLRVPDEEENENETSDEEF
ncbi:hypothetical protein DdX_12911 [Ditylenchus destructor]|uniref:DUF7083 domain-containing protein n=1 Tax=Ditylenchus destructor TaxID=166010 RepID=A0AAD4MTX4_9BILA|nr:hypothetical protein DdX_12911 [Ditylenchus destructor]